MLLFCLSRSRVAVCALLVSGVVMLSGSTPAATLGPYTNAATGHRYYVNDGVMTWQEADVWAVGLQGKLASITSGAEQSWIQANVPLPLDWVWIGATEDANTTDDVFVWSSGEPWLFHNFSPGEPDDNAGLGGQGDALVLERVNHQWLDMPPTLILAGGLAEVVPTTSVEGLSSTKASIRMSGLHLDGTRELTLSLPSAGLARVDILDVSGRSISRLLDGLTPAGKTRLTWNTSSTAEARVMPGLYFARLLWQDERAVVKVVVTP